jgi:hypothetical protein
MFISYQEGPTDPSTNVKNLGPKKARIEGKLAHIFVYGGLNERSHPTSRHRSGSDRDILSTAFIGQNTYDRAGNRQSAAC